MVIDTSALIAILFGEPEAEAFSRALADDPKKLISAFNALETGILVEAKKGEAGGRELDLLLHRARIEIVAMNADQGELARSAWRHWNERKDIHTLLIKLSCHPVNTFERYQSIRVNRKSQPPQNLLNYMFV